MGTRFPLEVEELLQVAANKLAESQLVLDSIVGGELSSNDGTVIISAYEAAFHAARAALASQDVYLWKLPGVRMAVQNHFTNVLADWLQAFYTLGQMRDEVHDRYPLMELGEQEVRALLLIANGLFDRFSAIAQAGLAELAPQEPDLPDPRQIDDLAEADRDFLIELAAAMKQIAAGATIYLYGSRARGEEHDGSDWDILVLTPQRLTTAERASLTQIVMAVSTVDRVVEAHPESAETWPGPGGEQKHFNWKVNRERIEIP